MARIYIFTIIPGADANARLGADVDRYSFIVVDLHHLLLAGLPAHFESYHLSHAVVSVGPLECAENPVRAASRYARRRRGSASILPRCSVSPALSRQAWPSASRSSVVYKAMVDILKAPKNDGVRAPR